MEIERRTRQPLPTWAKGLLALTILVATGVGAFYSVDEQVDYVSVETAVSGSYSAGERVQVHGVVLNQTREDCELVEGDYTLRVDLPGRAQPHPGIPGVGLARRPRPAADVPRHP